MRGTSKIVVSADPRGSYDEGVAGADDIKPGVVVQMVATTALVAGRFTWVVYNRAADGDKPAGPLAVVTEDYLRGGPVDDTFDTGARLFLYIPEAGDELNMLVLNIAGTADDHTAGEVMCVDDGTGKLVAEAGTERTAPFVLLETITDPTADTLAWTRFSGF